MEFHEKLQELRKRKGLTQEDLAQVLYVSRTAVSKWESGRGFPNIDSLKAISRYFHISLDELLSEEPIASPRNSERVCKQTRAKDLLFGLPDCTMLSLLFLPLFGQKSEGMIRAVPLLALNEIQPYVKGVYLLFVGAMLALGLATLALQGCEKRLWVGSKYLLSLSANAAGVCLFIAGQQPYAAVFVFAFLILKAFLVSQRPMRRSVSAT